VSTLAAAAERGFGLLDLAGGCSLGLAPTASTTTMLLWAMLWQWRFRNGAGSKKKICQFASWGKLGKRLARVEALMHSGEAIPRVTAATKMRT